jgi:predicted RecA/RadA family phage recombinase
MAKSNLTTEILLNDGGAPGRILPFTAGSTIYAGDPLQLTAADEQVDAATVSGGRVLGVALTAATSGNVVNVISGRGILLNAWVSGTAATAGSMLEARGTTGTLAKAANNANATAICLADGTASETLKKVMLL